MFEFLLQTKYIYRYKIINLHATFKDTLLINWLKKSHIFERDLLILIVIYQQPNLNIIIIMISIGECMLS